MVILLCDLSNFGGGAFFYRNLVNGDEAKVELQKGDGILCPSELEHRVSPVLTGVRASINIDFWSVLAEAGDHRSLQDKY